MTAKVNYEAGLGLGVRALLAPMLGFAEGRCRIITQNCVRSAMVPRDWRYGASTAAGKSLRIRKAEIKQVITDGRPDADAFLQRTSFSEEAISASGGFLS